MKTLKYMLLGVILSSLLFSSFSNNTSGHKLFQPGTVTFCETYTVQEVISKLDQDDQLFNWIQNEYKDPESARIGSCHQDNLDELLNYTRSQSFRSKVQEDLSIVPGDQVEDRMISLYAIRNSASIDARPSQKDVEEVSIQKFNSEENYALLLTFSESGAKKWAELTRANKGRDIAILFNDKVISAPRVREEIIGGKCSISGKYTLSEIKELKAVFEN